MSVGSVYLEDLKVGDSRSLSKIITEDLIEKFADVSEDRNPIHLDAAAGEASIFGERIAHGMLSAAYNSAVFGSLDGLVTSISPDAVQNEDGESFYTVEVQTTGALRDPDGRALRIGPGMMANVALRGERRSIMSYLFTPITRLTENAFRE